VGVSRGPGVAFPETESADEAVAIFVVAEAEVHAVGIVLAARETEILLQADVAGVVAGRGFLFIRDHRWDFIANCGLIGYYHVSTCNSDVRQGKIRTAAHAFAK
jgi:hypothetical protein